VVITTDEFLT